MQSCVRMHFDSRVVRYESARNQCLSKWNSTKDAAASTTCGIARGLPHPSKNVPIVNGYIRSPKGTNNLDNGFPV